MTKEEILAMEAGIELDGWVAEEVMGIKTLVRAGLITGEDEVPLLAYSEDISAAWQVVDRMEELGFYFRLDSWGVEFYASSVDMSKNTVTFGALASRLVCEAICKAALLAKMEGVDNA